MVIGDFEKFWHDPQEGYTIDQQVSWNKIGVYFMAQGGTCCPRPVKSRDTWYRVQANEEISDLWFALW